MQFPDARILFFAKAPVAGQGKTRLAPLLGAQGAADLHTACVRHTVAERCNARLARLAPVILYTTPGTSHPLFAELADRHPVAVRPQHGADLGERMRNAARDCLEEAGAVLLTGTDAPALRNEELLAALQALHGGADVVMTPAEDGGYVLLGLRGDHPGLFSAMPWGGAQVAAMTRARCAAAGLQLVELPVCWDVDRPEDLERLAAENPGFSAFRRFTQ